MSLDARLQRVEHRANGYGLQHTPGVILTPTKGYSRLIARGHGVPLLRSACRAAREGEGNG